MSAPTGEASTPAPFFRESIARIFVVAAIAALLLMHVAAVMGRIHSSLDHDEAEYLHASWLMGQGLRIYRDFMEDHPPFFFQLLGWFEPAARTADFPLLDVPSWVFRTRLFSVLCGSGAILAAGFAVARAVRNRMAALLTAAGMFAAGWMWQRGVLQVRPDAPTLMLFWAGVLLLMWNDESDFAAAVRCGIGMSLVVLAELWNPKWPLCGLVVGAFFLRRLVRVVRRNWRHAFVMIVPSLVAFAAVVALIASRSTVRDYIYFNFELKAANMERFRHAPWVVGFFNGVPPFMFSMPIGNPALVLALVAGVVAMYLWIARRRNDLLDRIALFELIALVIAAGLEVRFVYTYPQLWPQYYLMWAFAGAAILGAAYALLEAMLERDSARAALRMAAAVLAVIMTSSGLSVFAKTRTNIHSDVAWSLMSYMQRHLRPGETVWLSASLHPIAVRDASYFWYSPQDLIPDTLDYTRSHPESAAFLPQLQQKDLPPCALLRGEQKELRFIATPGLFAWLPEVNACAKEAERRGMLGRIRGTDVDEVIARGR